MLEAVLGTYVEGALIGGLLAFNALVAGGTLVAAAVFVFVLDFARGAPRQNRAQFVMKPMASVQQPVMGHLPPHSEGL